MKDPADRWWAERTPNVNACCHACWYAALEIISSGRHVDIHQTRLAIWRVVDRCVQVLGGQGVTDETIVERIFRDVRAFRIYDGPSEVHRWSIARRILKA